ncbi:hypothetical protein EBN03_22500 [Nocardia stercoris]|uniref:Uncharacterized protein n=1 Tax=Nocardia stercoris TaxID=2483361 RepID=A0A3M2L7A5_9NOCA|nr:hypothetical protein EBN03_22500 [Nocardia stercoris]
MGGAGLPPRPENVVLDSGEKSRVLEQVRRRGGVCHNCGNDRFVVGDALYLGFHFRSADPDAYLIALTCTDPDCPSRHTGITLARRLFLSETRTAECGAVPRRNR